MTLRIGHRLPRNIFLGDKQAVKMSHKKCYIEGFFLIKRVFIFLSACKALVYFVYLLFFICISFPIPFVDIKLCIQGRHDLPVCPFARLSVPLETMLNKMFMQ